MKKILLITLIFILQSFPSFGNSIDGKGLVCEHINKEDPYLKNHYLGLLFGDETMRMFLFKRSNDEVLLEDHRTFRYYTDKDQIYWINYKHKDYVDRKTLNLIQHSYSDDKKIHTHRCMVYENHYLFMKELHRIRKLKQRIYNESLRDNKI